MQLSDYGTKVAELGAITNKNGILLSLEYEKGNDNYAARIDQNNKDNLSYIINYNGDETKARAITTFSNMRSLIGFKEVPMVNIINWENSSKKTSEQFSVLIPLKNRKIDFEFTLNKGCKAILTPGRRCEIYDEDSKRINELTITETGLYNVDVSNIDNVESCYNNFVSRTDKELVLNSTYLKFVNPKVNMELANLKIIPKQMFINTNNKPYKMVLFNYDDYGLLEKSSDNFTRYERFYDGEESDANIEEILVIHPLYIDSFDYELCYDKDEHLWVLEHLDLRDPNLNIFNREVYDIKDIDKLKQDILSADEAEPIIEY